MSVRRLRILIEHLPPESHTKTAMRRDTPPADESQATQSRPDLAPWSGVEMLLAGVLDAVRLNTAVTIAAAGGKPAEFTPTPRPGIPPKNASEGRKSLTDEQRRVLDPRLRDQPKEA